MVPGKQINVVIHDKKFIFMVLKKCASVTLNTAIVSSLGHTDFSGTNINNIFRNDLDMLNKYEVDKLDYDKLTIVRNPYDRLVSGWFHRIRNNPEESVRDYGIAHTTSFEDYINYICSFDDKKLNVHFHQQTYDITIGDKIVPNLILKLENLQKDWEKVRKQFKWLSPLQWHIHKTNEKGNYKQYYTEALVKKVKNRFAKDLKLLNYRF